MPSKRLENFSKQNPSLAPLIEKLSDYIESLRQREVTEVIPRVAAAKFADHDWNLGGSGVAGCDALTWHWTAATGVATIGEIWIV